MIKAYHFLKADMTSGSGVEAPWEIGEQRTWKGKIALCQSGYHSSPTLWDALPYAPGPMACLVEVSEPVQADGEDGRRKQVSESRRLTKAVNIERELRLFAADCAERVLHLFEREHPNDDRPRKAIQAARDFADGKIDWKILGDARAAVWAAAGDARDVSWAARAATAAPWDAARDASWDAAWRAARDAGAATGEAGAARDAAGDASWAATRAAERNWQRQRFNQICEELLDSTVYEKFSKRNNSRSFK